LGDLGEDLIGVGDLGEALLRVILTANIPSAIFAAGILSPGALVTTGDLLPAGILGSIEARFLLGQLSQHASTWLHPKFQETLVVALNFLMTKIIPLFAKSVSLY